MNNRQARNAHQKGLHLISDKWYYDWEEISQEEAEKIDREQAISFENILDIPWNISEKALSLLPESLNDCISLLLLKRKTSKARRNLRKYAFEPVWEGRTSGTLWNIWRTLSYCRKDFRLNAEITIDKAELWYILSIKWPPTKDYMLTEEEFREILDLY